MHKRAIVGLTLFCTVGSGTDGGVYFAFSTFVMKALQRLPLEAAVPAMQQINDAAQNVSFAIALFGTGLASLLLGAYEIRHWKWLGSRYLLAAVVSYLVSLLVTFGCNVPLNSKLALVQVTKLGAAEEWTHYFDMWMLWNHTRTITALASTVLFGVALLFREEGER